jgi:hypothetical protein
VSTTIERHTQTILTTIVLALLAWVGLTVLESSQQITVLRVQVAELTHRIDERTGDRYRGDDAKRDFAWRDMRLDELSKRIDGCQALSDNSSGRIAPGKDNSTIKHR